MPNVERLRLIELLDADDGAHSAVAGQLLRSGAEFVVQNDAGVASPAAPLADTYRRATAFRERHGLDAEDENDLLARFDRADSIGALAVIEGGREEYHVFVSPDGDRVVATVRMPAVS